MTADDFLAWDALQPKEAGRFELINGTIIVGQSERVEHLTGKLAIVVALRDGIRRAKLPCTALPDGATVRVSAKKVYKPDGLVRCGKAVVRGTVVIPDPVIVVEVLSEDSVDRDHGEKLDGYFSVPSVMHYLIIDPIRSSLVHHRRGPGQDLLTRVRKSGMLKLDPTGIEIDLAAVFEQQP